MTKEAEPALQDTKGTLGDEFYQKSWNPRCRCGHGKASGHRKNGACAVDGCGCIKFSEVG